MTMEEIADLIAPPEEDIKAVQDWLDNYAVKHSLLKSRDWIVAELTVAQAEKMFNIKYSLFVRRTGRKVSATLDPYSVPFVVGLLQLGLIC